MKIHQEKYDKDMGKIFSFSDQSRTHVLSDLAKYYPYTSPVHLNDDDTLVLIRCLCANILEKIFMSSTDKLEVNRFAAICLKKIFKDYGFVRAAVFYTCIKDLLMKDWEETFSKEIEKPLIKNINRTISLAKLKGPIQNQT